MDVAASQPMTDPLHAFIAGAFRKGSQYPVPLVKTAFDVRLDGGLATVVTHRTFRNAEQGTIEATITFPVPVHAVLFHLRAKIDGRVVTAQAKRKAAARQAYEGAIESGKTAVLHEEVLRGVHMLSVAHIPAGAEIEVIAGWTMTLTNVEGRATLRIPLTVGDIYGRSRLPDSDDLISGGDAAGTADLTVTCPGGEVTLVGGRLENGRASVRLNQPIDLAVSGWTPRDHKGRAADGRMVTVRIEPASVAEAPLDVAILVDHSGSMNEPCSAPGSLTKHQALSDGLRRLGDALTGSDRIDLWEFNDSPTQIGTAEARPRAGGILGFLGRPQGINDLAARLRPPSGGTEIGIALDNAVSRSGARDLVLITDGKSHALDVQSLARRGRRISVVLVGDDSLEANVGHLAALSGGDIFVSTGADVARSLRAALLALRTPYIPADAISAPVTRIATQRAGMSVTAAWSGDAGPGEAEFESRAVGALAASLALPVLDEEAAAALAEAEGLVTHLTSLILIDEEGRLQEGLPGTRKVPVPMPAAMLDPLGSMLPPPVQAAGSPASMETFHRRRGAIRGIIRPSAHAVGSSMDEIADALDASPELTASEDADPELTENEELTKEEVEFLMPAMLPRGYDWLDDIAERIDWDVAPNRLKIGDLSKLDTDTLLTIRQAAGLAAVQALARQFGLDPVGLIVGLAACVASERNRSAVRVARAILGGKDPVEVAKALRSCRALPIASS